ncbi:hypothetical protein HYY69_06450 [Candidatus Woesearchaeota archaeon]|nr:hypothetical protein [Candidatus Woesearchaeota archaeon]
MKKFKLTLQQKILLADIGFWFFMSIFFLWIILKFAGVIKTPLWLQLLPQISIAASIVLFAFKVGSFVGGLNHDLKYIKKTLHTHTQKLDNLHYDFHKHLTDYNYHINKYHH